jgi:hypothetical protein
VFQSGTLGRGGFAAGGSRRLGEKYNPIFFNNLQGEF